MTSAERHELRYQRRKARRSARKAEKYAVHDNYDWVFSYDHLYQSYKMCRRNVAWKASVQKYIVQAPLNVWQTYESLQKGKYKSSGFYEFDIFERGKHRHIRSVTINERIVQRCLCDCALVPMLERTHVYDNGACMKNKGYTFTVNRLCQHLQKHYRKYGTEGYVLLFDFSKFFDRVSHRIIKATLRKEFSDERLIKITEHFIDAFGDVGLGLGSQISQVLALSSANKLDHYIKEVCRIKGYGRYMDDGYLIHHSKEYLQKCLEGIKKLCDELEITLNVKKTQIVKLSHGFTFLKIRFFLLDSGRIVRKIYRRSVTKMRRKLKSLRRKVDEGKMSYTDVYQSWQSWKSYAVNFDAYRTIQNMSALYNSLFVVPPTLYRGGVAIVIHSYKFNDKPATLSRVAGFYISRKGVIANERI